MKRLHEQYIIDKSGKKTAVLLPVEEYEELIEDLHDLAVIAERKDEPTISFEKIIGTATIICGFWPSNTLDFAASRNCRC